MARSDGLIGIFDSGVGGLSIAAAIHDLLPQESLLYYADQAHFPYGSRSQEEVQQCAMAATEFLVAHGAKLVVVACNTASSVALNLLRERFSLPFVGVVPGIKPGSSASPSAVVGVLATEATFHTEVFNDLVRQFAAGVELLCQVCPDLVAFVEAGKVETKEIEDQLRRALELFLAEGVDTIVLGCTHYSFLAPAIRRIAGPGVEVIDTAVPVARQVMRVLEANGGLRDGGNEGAVRLHTNGDTATFLRVAKKLWPQGVRELV